MKPKEEYLIGVQFPNSRSPRDFNMVLIAMQQYAEDYHKSKELHPISNTELIIPSEAEIAKEKDEPRKITKKKHGQTYEITKPNEWIRPIPNGYKMACCDCGLVHNLDFKIEDDRVWIRATRNNRSTAMVRRHKQNKK